MRRREFIELFGGALMASPMIWPLRASAQQGGVPVIGFLNNATPETYAPFITAFRRGLSQTGYTESQNVTIDYRWGRNQPGQMAESAKELVRGGAKVLVASAGDRAMDAAIAATATIPIVATFGNDPVETGVVRSLNRPEGNITGVSVFAVQLVPKQLQLARELATNAPTIAFLQNPTNPNAKIARDEIEAAGANVGQGIVVLDIATEAGGDAAFAKLAEHRAGALIVQSDPFFNGIAERLVTWTSLRRVPAIFPRREFVLAGGLMSYGSSLTEAYRQVGIYTGRILKGDKPADLPILFPSKLELVVNLKTANAQGIDLPTSILLRADEVIE